MKRSRILAALLLAALLLALLPASALAAGKVKTLKMNTWYNTQLPYSSNRTVYKLKLTATSVVYVSWKNATPVSDFSEVSFCKDSACSNIVDGVEMFYPSSGKEGIVLYPGTYYVGIFDIMKGAKVKFSTTKASSLKKTNTSRAKAISLAAGKKAKVVFDKKNKSARWFKLKLSAKKSVKLYFNDGFTVHSGDWKFYDSKLNSVKFRTDWDHGYEISTKKLAKGTYYVKLTVPSDMLKDSGAYAGFYWK